jgi:uncharacterized protein
MYQNFGLVLMVNHACNLRCSYCYTGAKTHRPMDYMVGSRAIDRAVASLERGGLLELGFFGGEPLVEAPLILDLIERARARTTCRAASLRVNVTTNGTQTSSDAWDVLTMPEVDVAISHDGLPHIHDRHRRTADGRATSDLVAQTIRLLVELRKDFGVVMVVRPDTVDALAEGMRYLRSLGVTRVDPSLDLWTHWTRDDAQRLEAAIGVCADLWIDALPDFSVSWFDEKTAALGHAPVAESARCGFGAGEIAVAPSGNLYPCERLIGEDGPDNAMRLPGHALAGEHFLMGVAAPARSDEACDECAMASICSTTCRCSNYVRTGRMDHPDGLLCLFNQVCARETARVLRRKVRTLSVRQVMYAR